MQGARHFVRISACSKYRKLRKNWEFWCGRISSFKSTLLQTLDLMISNWKIISNCCLPAFLREVLVNYASNMIRIRLNNCTIFWKQREFLHGLDNLQKLVSVGAIRRFIFSFFANQNFSRDKKAELLCKSIALVLQNFFSWAA